MSLRLTLAPSFSAARPHALGAWRARGGLLVVPRRAAATEALLAEAASAVVLDREALTFSALRGRVLAAAGAPEPEVPSRLGVRLALQEVLASADLSAFGDSARSPGFLTGVERAIGELRVARVPPGVVAAVAVTPVDRAVAALHAAAWEAVPHPADAVWTAALGAGGLRAFPPVTVSGFDDLVPGQWALLRALARVAEVEVVMPYADGRLAHEARRDRQAVWADGVDEVSWLASSPEGAPARLAGGLFDDGPPSGDRPPLMLGAAGTRGMLRAAVGAALDAATGTTTLDRVALVVPRLAVVRDDLERLLADWGVPARATTRARVLEAPLALALTHLLHLGELERDAPGALDHLLGWLRTPYSGAEPGEVDRFEVAARRGGVGSRGSLIARWDAEVIAPARRLVAAADRGPRAQLAAIVELGWQALRRAERADALPAPADVRDRRALAVLAGAAQAFAADEEAVPDEGDPRLRGPLPPGALGDLVADLSVEVRHEDAGGLEVHDFASVRGTAHDVVVLAGIDGDGYPPGAPADPFLAGLRPRLAPALPPRAPGTSESRLRFVHAVDAARERLVMVRRAVDDDGREVAPSPYWVEVARRVGRPIDHLDGRTGARGEVPGPAEVARSGREALRALALDGGEAPGLLADAARRRVRPVGVPAEAFHDRRCFRVTELESYLRCPYGWFHASVLRPQELEVVIDPRFEGTLGHEVLGRLYARMRDAGVGACRPATLGRYREELAVVLAAVVADERPPHGDAVFDATAERLGRHLAAVLGRDAERDSPLVPTVIETRMEDEAILAPVAAGLVLSGQVDRVDVGREGAVVIDYKRTRGDFSAAGDDVRRRLQLPLYGVMAERALSPGVPAVGGLYVGLLTSSLNGAVRDDVPGPAVPRRLLVPEERWREIVGEAVDAARGAVTRIREGRLDPPSAGGCGYWCMCGDLWR